MNQKTRQQYLVKNQGYNRDVEYPDPCHMDECFRYELVQMQKWKLSSMYVKSKQFKHWESDVIRKYLVMNRGHRYYDAYWDIQIHNNFNGTHNVYLYARPCNHANHTEKKIKINMTRGVYAYPDKMAFPWQKYIRTEHESRRISKEK